MTTINDDWDVTKPAPSRNPKTGDDDIREFKRGVEERLRNGGHHWETSVTTDQKAGRHRCGAAGTANELILAYKTDASTAIITIDDSGTDTIDMGGFAVTNASNVTTGNNPGHAHDTTLIIPIDAAVGRSKVFYENRGNGTITLLEVGLVAFTAPTTTDLEVDIHKIATADWASGSGNITAAAGFTLVATAPVITLTAASGDDRATPVTTFDAAAGDPTLLEVGAAWVFEVDTLSAANDILVTMKIRRS